ncbi:MAG TPA: ATP phosphoribosyltransferase regulatory subunit [Polyangiaceae bacterium]|nr:ATP phosphoribosyltransferase regulatory subunit [Polyangiaceae bacterium]
MRDWLPRQARRRARVSESILSNLELFGYQRVELPLFEYTDVLERGFGNAEEALCFVEPESGKITALRSDVTPQIARLVSTRHAEGPWPARLSYQASVLRRRRERARLDQQVLQVGFELVGASAEQSGDLEVLEAATSALSAAGVRDFTVDLAHAQIVGALVDPLESRARAEALECLALKDRTELRRVGARAGLSGSALEALVALPELHGGADVWPRAERALAGTAAEAPMRGLERVWRAALAAQLAPRFVIDLGEAREFYYYTGVMFHLLAEGPGEPLGSGGRYDTLFERFELPRPAAGFAFHISNVCWALDAQGEREPARARVLVSAPPADPRVAPLLKQLRARGVACTTGPEADRSDAYALHWDYTHVLQLGAALPGAASTRLRAVPAAVAEDTPAGEATELLLDGTDVGNLARVVAGHLGVLEER